MQNFASGKIPAVGKIVTTRTGAKVAIIPGHTTTGKKAAYKGRPWEQLTCGERNKLQAGDWRIMEKAAFYIENINEARKQRGMDN
eukprot:g20947.t1